MHIVFMYNMLEVEVSSTQANECRSIGSHDLGELNLTSFSS